MPRIAIVIGSARPGPKSEAVAKWAYEIARKRSDADFELLDIAEFNLPLLDESLSAATSDQYSRPHTREWSVKIASFDGYVFVAPEYDHGTSGALKNAIDFLNNEWTDKAAGFTGYTMGARSNPASGNGLGASRHCPHAGWGCRCSQSSRTPGYSNRRRCMRGASTPRWTISSHGAARYGW